MKSKVAQGAQLVAGLAVFLPSSAEALDLLARHQLRLSAALLNPATCQTSICDGSLLNLAIQALGETSPSAPLGYDDIRLALDEVAQIRVRQGEGMPAWRLADGQVLAVVFPLVLQAEGRGLCADFKGVRDGELDPAEKLAELRRVLGELKVVAGRLACRTPAERLARVQAKRRLACVSDELQRLQAYGWPVPSATLGECTLSELIRHFNLQGLSFAPCELGGEATYTRIFLALAARCRQQLPEEVLRLAETQAQQRAERRRADLDERRERISTAAAEGATQRRGRIAANRNRPPDVGVPGDPSVFVLPQPAADPASTWTRYWYRTYRYSYPVYRTYRYTISH
ncbi:MAG: hypothetical protein K1X74_17200 [Pirellulales bacterium]|nr:hypothetical protein [Pirellulales bacterium]